MLEMVTSGSFSSILSMPQVASVSQREAKLSPKEKGLSLYLGRQESDSENLMRIEWPSLHPHKSYFGGPEAKVPTSSNKSNCEREDFALTGVSCSITCISDSTEWETELRRKTELRVRAVANTHVTAQRTQAVGISVGSPSHPEPSPTTCV